MSNEVFLGKEGFVIQIYEGKQTFQTVTETAARLMTLSDELQKDGRIKILINIDKITQVSADSLLAAADALNAIPKSKIAIFGGNKLIINLANLVILATGRSGSVRIFRRKSQAVGWLRGR